MSKLEGLFWSSLEVTASDATIDSAPDRVHAKTAGERDVIAAFADKARGKAERLKALRDFLSPRGAVRAK